MQDKTLVMGLPRWQQAFLRRHRLPDACLPYAQQWFVLLAQRLAEHQIGAGRTVLVALNGTQGSGLRKDYRLRLPLPAHDFYQLDEEGQVISHRHSGSPVND